MTEVDIMPRRRRAARRLPVSLHISSVRFTVAQGPPRMATVLVSGRMDQCAAMAEAMTTARTQGRDPWLTDVSTVRPLRATPTLDAICDRWTAARSFLDLLTQPAGYRPTIRLDLMGREGVLLARAYNRVQRAWGDPRRAYVTGGTPDRAGSTAGGGPDAEAAIHQAGSIGALEDLAGLHGPESERSAFWERYKHLAPGASLDAGIAELKRRIRAKARGGASP